MKRYGIYLDYGPTSELHAQGLGRQLANFLKGAAERPDVTFVVACPSWGRLQLEELCEAEHVPRGHFEFLSPEAVPLSLRAYRGYQLRTSKKREPRGFWRRFRRIRAGFSRTQMQIERRLVSTRSVIAMSGLLLVLTLIATASTLLRLVLASWRSALHTAERATTHSSVTKLRSRLIHAFLGSSGETFIRRLYRHLEQAETDLLIAMINRRTDIAVWYCPTAFWPQFNRIQHPRLMCVPDAVVAEFPVGFELLGGQSAFDRFQQLQTAIRGATHCVTFSEHIKWQVLVRNYDFVSSAVQVVPHASQDLLPAIRLSGTSDDERATDSFSRQQFSLALRAASNSAYISSFKNRELRYIFYASQFRPSKNIISFLRAYRYLLRSRYAGFKLILTGVPSHAPEIVEFIADQRLSQDILFLSGLPLQQLAACYRLASLAVNPSLSEGGFPFTFTEALSVGTPVVMARIPVTEEVITDPDLQSLMLFNPYDWNDMANRIEWALEHRVELLAKQKPLYDRLAHRTWRHVVDDHIEIFNRIADQRCNVAAKT